MSLRSLFTWTTARAATQVHPTFGVLSYAQGRGWENDSFEFWGFRPVHLMIDAGIDGPTPTQEAAFQRLRDERPLLLPRCLTAIAAERVRTGGASTLPSLTTVSVPTLNNDDPARTARLWTLWFDYAGEEHWSYGVQTIDDWQTLTAFADD